MQALSGLSGLSGVVSSAASSPGTKIYTGASATPDPYNVDPLKAWAVVDFGVNPGTLTVVGKDVYCTHPENLLGIDCNNFAKNRPDLDGAFDFSACVNMTGEIGIDWNAITACVVTGLTQLTSFVGGENAMTAFNASSLTACTIIDISNNSIASLTLAAGSSYTACTEITFQSNAIAGTLDFSAWPALARISVNDNLLTGLNIGSLVLNVLTVKNNSGLTGTLDLTGSDGLGGGLDISGTGYTSLICPNMTALGSNGGNALVLNSALTALDYHGCTAMITAQSGTLPASLLTLDVNGCTALATLALPTALQTFDAHGCSLLTSFGTAPASLTSLNINGCKFSTAINVSACTGLATFNFNNQVSVASNSPTISYHSGTYLVTVDGSGNKCAATAVNNTITHLLDAASVGVCNLTGANMAAPTGASITRKATLNLAGNWTITTN